MLGQSLLTKESLFTQANSHNFALEVLSLLEQPPIRFSEVTKQQFFFSNFSLNTQCTRMLTNACRYSITCCLQNFYAVP